MPFNVGGAAVGGETISKSVTQTAHGLAVLDAVYIDATGAYIQGRADADATSDIVGVVSAVAGANAFTLTQQGYVSGFTGLTPGQGIFLSDAAPGLLSQTEPTSPLSWRKPVGIAVSATTAWVDIQPGTPVEGQTAVIQHGENNGITNGFNIPNASVVDISGSSFTLPYAGVWEVSYNVFFRNTTSNVSPTIFIADNSNAAVANSYASSNSTNSATDGNVAGMVSNRVVIATTGEATYKLRGNSSAGSVTISNVSATTTLGGSSKISWTQIGASPVPMSLAGEHGENNSIVDGQTTTSTTFVDVTGGSFTLPTAGTWDITYIANVQLNAAGNQTQLQLADSLGTAVPNSITTNNHPSTNPFYTTQTSRVSTGGSATYKLQWKAVSGNIATLQNDAIQGNSKIIYRKVSGFVPTTGSTVDFVNATLTANQTTNLAIGDHVKFDTVASGNIAVDTSTTYSNVNGAASIGRVTLIAGKTYRLSGSISVAANSATGISSYQWFNATTGTSLPGSSVGFIQSPANTSTHSRGGIALATFTPTVNTLVELRITSTITSPIDGASGTSIFIEQLGSTAITTTNRAMFRGYHSVNLSMTGSNVNVLADTETFDTTGSFSAGTFTCPRAGFYRVSVSGYFTGSFTVTQEQSIAVRKNGTAQTTTFAEAYQTGTNELFVNAIDLIQCNAGDTITATAVGTSGTTFNMNSSYGKFLVEEVTAAF